MRTLMAGFLVLAWLSAGNAMAQTSSVRHGAQPMGHNLGAGISFVGPTGISLYGETSVDRFVQASFGSMGKGDYQGTLDYAFSAPHYFATVPNLTPYWGVGLVGVHDSDRYKYYPDRVRKAETDFIGARIPVGVNFVIPRAPLQVAAEVAPSVVGNRSSYVYVQGGLAARVLF